MLAVAAERWSTTPHECPGLDPTDNTKPMAEPVCSDLESEIDRGLSSEDDNVAGRETVRRGPSRIRGEEPSAKERRTEQQNRDGDRHPPRAALRRAVQEGNGG